MAASITPMCPYCRLPMKAVVSGRYWHCVACASLGTPVYVPIGDAPPHPLHGARIAAQPVTTNPPQPRPAASRPARRQHPQGARR